MTTLDTCPSCDIKMEIKDLERTVPYKGVEVSITGQVLTCPGCNMEVGTAGDVGKLQRAIADAYRSKVGLLSGGEIRAARKKLGLSQQALADKMTVGIASIKRWEGTQVQSPAMDKALRSAFWEKRAEDNYLGNRPFSLSRIKLVLESFNSSVKENLLKSGDKLLFSAKYLWYADFMAYREHGRGMTGATYASLPYGPQLNNYKELNDLIWNANSDDAEPLSTEEKKIIAIICDKFPTPKSVYDASHSEYIWEKRATGEIIPYSDAIELTYI